jgi:hypothetical protein
MLVRLFSVLLLSLFCFFAKAQIVSDDFEDGDFTSNPEWTGNTTLFSVNGDNELQLDDDQENLAYLSTSTGAVSLDNREWYVWAKLSFSPSGNNNARIYLAADQADISYSGTGGASVNGYFLQLGESGSDDAISLYRNDADENTELIASGTAGAISSSFEIAIQVARDDAGNWTISVNNDPENSDIYILEAAGTDDTYTTLTHLGVTCKYTSSNSTNFYFDDFYFGDPFVDTDPPEVLSLDVVSSTQLELLFNEPLDQATAENTTNYNVDGFGQPAVAELDSENPALVFLTFVSDFPANEEQILTVEGVEDIDGNAIGETDIPFTFFNFDTPEPGDVIFNEIMADPTPVVGLPEFEFVEIHNTSDGVFNLQGWVFVNTNTEFNLPSQALPPGGFLILCDMSAVSEFESFGPTLGLTSFSALANSGDSLTLRSTDGTIIDIVDYTDSWYNDPEKDDGGWTLERINPVTECSAESNWTASEAPLGGTPGAQNSVYDITPDTEAPTVTGFVADGTTVIVNFSEPIDEDELELSDFSFVSGLPISTVEVINNGNAVELTLSEPLEVGVEYTLFVASVFDCAGNELVDFEITLISGFEPEPGDIIFTEIMADPTPAVGLPESEYLEIYNRSESVIDLNGCSISGVPIDRQVLIYPGEYRILLSAGNQEEFEFFANAVGLEDFSSTFLTNSGKLLELFNANDDLIDSVEYEDTWYQNATKAEGGWSLELINPEAPCSSADNWIASQNELGGTPGEQNSVFDPIPDTTPPNAIAAYPVGAGEFEILFDSQVDEDTPFDIVISIEPDLETGFVSFDPDNPNFLNVLLADDMQEDVIYTVTVSQFADCWGNVQTEEQTLQVAIPETAEEGDLIINEVLFNPRGDGSDYVEIYNNSQKIISLEGWQLANEEDGIPADQELITERAVLLFPGDYLAITDNKQNVVSTYPFAKENRILQIEGMPSYANSDGVVYLTNFLLEPIDRFAYSEDYHFELLNDPDGVSLERISFDNPTNDPENWISAAENQGFGTPGYENSQAYFGTEETVEEVLVDPELFSPDNDGFQDVTNIHYEFSEPGYAVNVTIYDDHGREVVDLVNNEVIGTSGSFVWDGITDRGELARMGIYIVYFEVFDLDGNISGFKKTCVVGHKLN